MRIATIAATLSLLIASTASAQPEPVTASAPPPAAAAAPPAPASGSTLPSDPRLAASIDSATATAPTNPWAMNGARAWVNAEYLLWWVKPMNSPDLIQTVPTATALNAFATNTSLPTGAATRFFPDGKSLDFGAISGVRGTAGVNFDRFGIEGSAFYLPQKTSSASLFNDGTAYSVAESYFRAGSGVPISLLASLAGQSTGGIESSISTKLWGAEGNVRLPFYNFLTDTTDALVGFRYLDLNENLGVNFRSTLGTGTTVLIQDAIQTTNHFYGGQVGLNGKINGTERGIGLDITNKFSIGDMKEQATLAGSNTVLVPGQLPSTQPGGLYASGPNQGTFTRDKFAFLYELNSNLTYNFNSWSQVYIGYSIIYVSNVMRAGQAINPVINDSQLRFVANPPPSNINAPEFRWRGTEFWTQGINFGLRLQY